jgi:hypothetical protein
VTPPLASNRRLQKRRRHPTVFCRSLPIETLQYCIAFVGKGHYRFVGSICKQINKIYANEDKDMKVTFWSNVAVNRNLAKLCFKDHEKLG